MSPNPDDKSTYSTFEGSQEEEPDTQDRSGQPPQGEGAGTAHKDAGDTTRGKSWTRRRCPSKHSQQWKANQRRSSSRRVPTSHKELLPKWAA